MDQARAEIDSLANEYAARGQFWEALVTLPDYERLAALARWQEQGIPHRYLLGDPRVQDTIADLLPR